MTVNYTTNLGLGQPVVGQESGTWGSDVNNSVTSYLDIAIAGGLAITIDVADVTLALTTGDSTATNIISTGASGSTAQYATLIISGTKTAARNLNVPASSRNYLINNSVASGGYALTVRGLTLPSTYTTGITLVDGEKAIVAWNGTDYVKIASSSGPVAFTTLTASGSAATPPVVVAFSATAMAINCALSNVFTTTMTLNVTVAPTFSNLTDGQTINWFITQDATGSRTMTWPTSFKWAGGSTFTGVLSTSASAVDLLVATYRSSTGFWYASLAKGFA